MQNSRVEIMRISFQTYLLGSIFCKFSFRYNVDYISIFIVFAFV